MKQYKYYSEHQKERIVSALKVNDKRIKMLWEKALLNYSESKRSIGKKSLEHSVAQRKYRNWIMNIALDTYNAQDPTTKKKMRISESFTEFWDYLHFFLKGKVPNGGDKWNEMEDSYHEIIESQPDNKK